MATVTVTVLFRNMDRLRYFNVTDLDIGEGFVIITSKPEDKPNTKETLFISKDRIAEILVEEETDSGELMAVTEINSQQSH